MIDFSQNPHFSGLDIVSSDLSGFEGRPKAVALDTGGYAVVWNSSLTDGSGWGIYLAVYDENHVKVVAETQINTFTLSDQRYPSIAQLSDGTLIVTWESFGQDELRPREDFLNDFPYYNQWGVFAQRVDTSGVLLGDEFQINTTVSQEQLNSRVTALPDGGFFVTWDYAPGNVPVVGYQRFDENGDALGSEKLIERPLDGYYANLSLTVKADGTLLGIYTSPNGNFSSFWIRDFKLSGRHDGPLTEINASEDGYLLSSVTPMENGNFIVRYLNSSTGATASAFRVIDGNGDTVSDLLIFTTPQFTTQNYSTVTLTSNGGFMILSFDRDPLPEGSFGHNTRLFMAAQFFDAQGEEVGDPVQVTLPWFDLSRSVQTTFLEDGTLLVTLAVETMFGVPEFTTEIVKILVAFADEGDATAFTTSDDTLTLSETQINVDALEGNDTVTASTSNTTLQGGGGDDTLSGNLGLDLLFGGTGQDTLHGGGKDDLLYGGLGDDKLIGGTGDDFIEGGSGNDISIGNRGDDTLIGDHGSDQFFGGAGDDSIYDSFNLPEARQRAYGGGGNDIIRLGGENSQVWGGTGNDLLTAQNKAVGLGKIAVYGGAGDDIISTDGNAKGGGGNDVFSYYSAHFEHTLDGGTGVDTLLHDLYRRLKVDLADGTIETNYNGNVAYLHRFENIVATSGLDIDLAGNSSDNTFQAIVNNKFASVSLAGRGGDDVLISSAGSVHSSGGTGHDYLQGGSGRDSLFGDAGHDSLIAGSNKDTLFGGGGDDDLFGGGGEDSLFGGAGDDTLTGGRGSDAFVFRNTFGTDLIADFETPTDADRINLSTVAAFSNFATMIATQTTQVDADTVIEDGAGNVIVLLNTDLDDLTQDHFTF